MKLIVKIQQSLEQEEPPTRDHASRKSPGITRLMQPDVKFHCPAARYFAGWIGVSNRNLGGTLGKFGLVDSLEFARLATMREFLLGNEWLDEIVDRLDGQGWSVEQMTDHINAWVALTVGYVIYLSDEGYSSEEIVEIVRSAVDEADFDLAQMPIIPTN